MEAALSAMAWRHTHVVVRMFHHNQNPIRIRLNLVKSARFYIYRPWVKASIPQVAKWVEHGGILLDYSTVASQRYEVGPNNAFFFYEAPHTLYDLEGETRNTEIECVVFDPPSWDAHIDHIMQKHPEPDIIRGFITHLGSLPPASDRVVSYLMVNEIKHDDVILVPDSVFKKALGMSAKEVLTSRKFHYSYNHSYSELYEIAMNLHPNHPRYVGMWDHLESRRIEGDNRLIIHKRFLKAYSAEWNKILKEMQKLGFISVSGRLWPYWRSGRKADYEKIAQDRRNAFSEFELVRRIIETAPYYDLKAGAA